MRGWTHLKWEGEGPPGQGQCQEERVSRALAAPPHRAVSKDALSSYNQRVAYLAATAGGLQVWRLLEIEFRVWDAVIYRREPAELLDVHLRACERACVLVNIHVA